MVHRVSLPAGVFSSAGAGVKTNLLFFTKGGPTERVWYYDLSDVKVGKKTAAHASTGSTTSSAAADAGRLASESGPCHATRSRRSNFDLKAVNPNAKSTEDTRTPEELLDIIEAKGREVDEAIRQLRALLRDP